MVVGSANREVAPDFTAILMPVILSAAFLKALQGFARFRKGSAMETYSSNPARYKPSSHTQAPVSPL